jgi:hypothetical protein
MRTLLRVASDVCRSWSDYIQHVQEADDTAELPLCVMRKHIPTTYQCASSRTDTIAMLYYDTQQCLRICMISAMRQG